MKGETNEYKNLLDHQSPIPLHYQLSGLIRKELLNGHLVDENGKLPNEHFLADQFDVSRITVRSALNTLTNEGFLDRKRGSGTFLKSNKSENWMGELKGFSETIEAIGLKPGAEVLKKGMAVNPSEDIKSHLMMEEVWELKRLRFADGIPIAIEHSYFPKEIGLKLEQKKGLTEMLTYQFIENDLNMKLHEGKQVISAVNADAEAASLLDITEGEALLYIERITLSIEGTPIEYLQSVYRPDYFRYEVKLNRRGRV